MKIMKTFSIQRLSLACALLLTLQASAGAHAFLDHAKPAVGGKISKSPAEVQIWFTQKLEPAFSSLQVRDARGNQVDKQDAHVDSQNKALLAVSLPPLEAGTYTVIWRVVSVDTHKTQGRFEFTIQ